MSDQQAKPAHPLTWVPTTYFGMGTIYMTVTMVTNIMYANLGASVKEAALTASALGLPYTIKFLWAPLLEMYRTKKFFVIAMQLLIAAALGVAAMALGIDPTGALTMSTFWLIGFAGATMDVASDGVYVTGLTAEKQAKFTGFQSMCWSIGPIFATGVLVTLSGVLYDDGKGMSYAAAWRVVLLVVAALMVTLAVVHMKFLPAGAKAANAPTNVGDALKTFGHAWVSFFQKKSVWIMIAFAFFYRTSQGFLDKIGPLFMMDDLANGGLGLNNQVLGTINGTVGTIGFIAGSLLGGLFVARKGLKNVLMLLCIAINVPNATYIVLGLMQPDNVYFIGSIVTLEKFWFGFGAVGHMLYMMQQLAPGHYKTAHYAFGTALMGLVMMLTGMASGYIHEPLGYVGFFIFVMVATLPSFAVTFFAPFHVNPDSENSPPPDKPEAAAA